MNDDGMVGVVMMIAMADDDGVMVMMMVVVMHNHRCVRHCRVVRFGWA